MVKPNEILPANFNLAWSMSYTDCLQVINKPVVGKILNDSFGGISTDISVEDEVYKVQLDFDQTHKLYRVIVFVFEDDYYDEQCDTQEMYEEIDKKTREYTKHYEEIVEQYIRILGTPTFKGTWEDENYPEDQSATLVTYWLLENERFQVAYDHADKEMPFVIYIGTYKV